MDVSNPRRILAVSLEGQADHLSRVIKDLTGSAPQPTSTSLAGTSHDLKLKTQYYSATVPIWLDLIASPSEWSESFLSDEAGEVLAVLGGLVLVIAMPSSSAPSTSTNTSKSPVTVDDVKEVIHHIGEVVNKGLGGWEWDGVRLAIGVGDSDFDEWDELCAEAGLEFVQVGGSQGTGLNEFGEKTGIARVREAIESNDWAQADLENLSDFGDFKDSDAADPDKDLDPENLDFGYDRADFEGLRKAIWEASNPEDEEGEHAKMDSSSITDLLRSNQAARSASAGHEGDVEDEIDDDDVVKVEKMMKKLQAVREAGEGLPEAQRRRMAARAVEEVMKEL